VVVEGPFADWTLRQLIESFPNEMIGHDNPSERFPLLLKYLDCQRVLSVQVHPDDAFGATMTQPDRGKTEAWYVIEAEPDSVLYAGLKPGISKAALIEAIEAGNTEECLHVLHPRPGDCVFIPAGTVHALGAGLLVAEIQQASDCTFRLFDWNRLDKDGQSRPLHVEQALEVIDFERGPVEFVTRGLQQDDGSIMLIECDKFLLREYTSAGLHCLDGDTFRIVTVPKGSAVIEYSDRSIELTRGQSVLLPAACRQASLRLIDSSIALVSTIPLGTK
jgi:mannose-6-phosphate isomerase